MKKWCKGVIKMKKWRFGLLGLFLVMMVVGVVSGEASVVLDKAIRICLECIGIG